MLLTAGERISMALVSMAINDLGREAASFTGSQAGIVTDTSHGRARIVEMRRGRVHEALEEGRIAIVAGFQGVSTNRDITTLGRGGSDTTAVALAAALGADVCEIYTDVDGVYSADPRICPEARKRDQVLVRGDARPGGCRRPRAGAACRRVRSQPQREAPRPLVVQRQRRHVGHQGGGHGTGDHLGRCARHERGEGHDSPRSRPSRRRRPHIRAARGGGDQHRRDRPEHLDRRPRRHLLHAARERARARRADPRGGSPRRSAPRASPPSATSPRSR